MGVEVIGKNKFLTNLFVIKNGEENIPECENFEQCLEYVIHSGYLTPVEGKVLRETYLYNGTLQFVSDLIGKSVNETLKIQDSAMCKVHKHFYELFKYSDTELINFLLRCTREERTKRVQDLSALRYHAINMQREVNNLCRKNYPDETIELLYSINVDLKKLVNKCIFMKQDLYDIDGISVKHLGLPKRMENLLELNGYHTLKDFRGKNLEMLLSMKGIGYKSLALLVSILADYGIAVKY